MSFVVLSISSKSGYILVVVVVVMGSSSFPANNSVEAMEFVGVSGELESSVVLEAKSEGDSSSSVSLVSSVSELRVLVKVDATPPHIDESVFVIDEKVFVMVEVEGPAEVAGWLSGVIPTIETIEYRVAKANAVF